MSILRPATPQGEVIKGKVTKVNTFMLYFVVEEKFRIYADLFDTSLALPCLNDTVEVINPVKCTDSMNTAVTGQNTICNFSTNSDCKANPFLELFQTHRVKKDAEEILAIDYLVRRLEPFVMPEAMPLCLRTLYECIPSDFEGSKSIKQVLARTPKDLQYSNSTSKDYDFLGFNGCCTFTVYPNRIDDCETEYLFGFLAARESDGCMSLKDHKSEILVKFMAPHENLHQLHNCLVLIKKYTVFNEIYQDPKQQTLHYILLNTNDVFIVISGVDKGRRKLIYGKEESLSTDLKYSYFLQTSRISETIFGYNNGPECWLEALISPYEDFHQSEWVYAIVPKEFVEIQPFLEECVIYKIFTDEKIKYGHITSYRELYGMKEIKKVIILSLNSIFKKTDFQPVGAPGVVLDDFLKIKSHIANTADFKTFSFALSISKKEFQPTMYASWYPMRHKNLKYFGNVIEKCQQNVIFWNEETKSYMDLFLTNRDNHFIPLGLIANMKVKFKHIQVFKRKYLRSTVFTRFDIIDYCPEIRFSCVNLSFNDRSSWRWRTETAPTLLGLYKYIPRNCVVHGTVLFRALLDLKLYVICAECGKRFLNQCCVYCNSVEKDFQVFMIIHAQDSINPTFYMEIDNVDFLLELVGLSNEKAFFQKIVDPLEIDFLNIPEDFVIDVSNPVLQKIVTLIRTKINYKVYFLMHVACLRQVGENRKPWKVIEFIRLNI